MTRSIFRITCVFLGSLLFGIAEAGSLFVSDNTTVQQYDSTTGVLIRSLTGGGLALAQGLAIGPDGKTLYVADFTNSTVLRFDSATGAFLGVFVPAGSGGLKGPNGIAFGLDGNLYVADSVNGRVLEYDGSTAAFIRVFVSGLSNPNGIAFGPDGNLYVADGGSSQVRKYSGIDGTFIAGSLTIPGAVGVTFGGDGNLYVTDFTNSLVVELNPANLGFIKNFVPSGSGGLARAYGLAFGFDNNLYVVDSLNARVLKYDGNTGAFLGIFVPSGSPGFFTYLTFGSTSPVVSGGFRVRYASNLGIADSVVDITNTGASSSLSFPTQNGNLCVNVYTFSPDEQLISCCSCLVTPNGLVSLSARDDLISNTLTPGVPNSIVIKLLATAGTTAASCNAATVGTGMNVPAAGLAAWGTTIHALALPRLPTTYGITETPFLNATLSAAERTRITSLCGFIQTNGSGFGICRSCRLGGLGASKF